MPKYTLNTASKPSSKTNIQLKISPSTVSRAASINNYIEMKVSDITRQFRFFLVKHIVFITVCFALLFFSEAVRQLIQNWFLDNGWGVVDSSIVNDVLFYAAAIVIGCLSYLKLKSTIKGRVLDTSILMALYVAVISYYCSGVFRTHNIVSTHFVDGVKYVYLLYAPVLGLACWWLFRLIRICKKWCKKKEQPQSDTNHNGFVGDEPIENVDESIYPNTKEYANQLCENLLNTNNQKFAFAAGVTGDWGSGKTSFLNCMKDYLKKKDVIIVEFNPWMCDSPERIVKEFFLLLKERLEIYSPFIGNYFDEYIALLLSSNEHFMLKSLRSVFNKRSESTTALYEKLKSDIECIGKKIIVFIDDLDRLNSDEILVTLQLIRNFATFPQIRFVAAYDKGYITKCMGENSSSAKYIEKIFNVEVNMPAFDKSILLKILCDKIETAITFKDETTHGKIKEFILSDKHGLFKHNINTLRDVTRFVNSLKQNISSCLVTLNGNDIDVNNFIALELLRVNHPQVYQLLRNNREDLLQQKLDEYVLKGDINTAIFKPSKEVLQHIKTNILQQTQAQPEKPGKTDKTFSEVLNEILKNENEETISILKYLFGGNTHISKIAYYSRYFVYGLSANEILYDDYLLTIKGSDCAARFKIWSNEDKLVAIDANIKKSLYDKDLEVKDILNGIISYAEMRTSHDIFGAEFTREGFDEQYLFNILLKYEAGVRSPKPNKDNINSFLSICKEDNNLIGKSFTIYQLLHSHLSILQEDNNFTKLRKLLCELILRYFKKVKFEYSDFGMMYLLNLYSQRYPEDKYIIPKFSKCRTAWVERNINSVIKYTIYAYDGKEFFVDRDFATAVWGNKKVMDDQLSQLKAKNDNVLTEYIDFIKTTFEDKNNEEKYYYVDSFKYIKDYRTKTEIDETWGITKDPSFYTLSEQRRHIK